MAVRPVAISTARAGNVIGGGDFAADRIIPDCVRAVLENRQIIVRNPLFHKAVSACAGTGRSVPDAGGKAV